MPPTKAFEASAWSSELTPETHVRNIRVKVTEEHVKAGYWNLCGNPVSLAIREHLHDHACASLIWNSDGFAPRYPEDEARIGIHVETFHPDTGEFQDELNYHLPLSRRAAKALWKLRCQGIHFFKPFTMSLNLPDHALKDEAS